VSDALVALGAAMFVLALAFAWTGRKRPAPAAPSKPAAPHAAESPEEIPTNPELRAVRAVPQGQGDEEETTFVGQASTLEPLLGVKPAEISPLLAEALAEAREAFELAEAASAVGALPGAAGNGPKLIYQGGSEVDEKTGPFALVDIEVCGDTDCGLKRAQNEDALLLSPELGLFAVADGMGGYTGGRVASSLAVDALRESFTGEAPSGATRAGVPRRALEIASAMQHANEVVFRAAQSQPELREMGTTLVALRFVANKQRIYVGHVGDSRCYRLRDGELRQLTTDHAMKELGLTGPRGNDLFKAIGIEEEVGVDVVVDKPLPGDAYLLCTDGLTKMVPHERIRETLLQELDPEAAVYDLIEQANDAGGKDNVTVVLARVSSPIAADHGAASEGA
jgi:serine/threonine protein phosphatase PrpC